MIQYYTSVSGICDLADQLIFSVNIRVPFQIKITSHFYFLILHYPYDKSSSSILANKIFINKYYITHE